MHAVFDIGKRKFYFMEEFMQKSLSKLLFGGYKVMDFKDKETGDVVHLTKLYFISKNVEKKDNLNFEYYEGVNYSTRENIDIKKLDTFKHLQPVYVLLDVPAEKDKSPKFIDIGKSFVELVEKHGM